MRIDLFDKSDHLLRTLARGLPPRLLRARLNAAATSMGDAAFGVRVAQEVVHRTRPEQAVPDVHAAYRSVVRDGIAFFLGRIGRERLVDLVVALLRMDPQATVQARLLEMAKRFPTLHKLGQMIARHPRIDPCVKQWLIPLECGHYGAAADALRGRIQVHLPGGLTPRSVHIHPNLLREASVGAVIRFDWRPTPEGVPQAGVFKLLKPGVRRHVKAELRVLEQTAAFFEDRRADYPLKNLRLADIFRDVREMLLKEIDLSAEQANLDEAARFYRGASGVHIPQCLPLSAPEMTAMTFLRGPKITDASFGENQLRYLATALFEALVCMPLFASRETALFHGDPHAGNILALADPETGAPGIGLLDWSLAGRLSKRLRIQTVRLIQAVVKTDVTAVVNAVYDLACRPPNAPERAPQRLYGCVDDLMQRPEFLRVSLIRKTFRLLEELALSGMVFPADLMLFRKAIFTLEGVLHDICPAFDMDAAMVRYLADLAPREIPLRCINLLMPLADRPERYPSLISNLDLQSLAFHQFAHAMQAWLQASSATLACWGWPLLACCNAQGEPR